MCTFFPSTAHLYLFIVISGGSRGGRRKRSDGNGTKHTVTLQVFRVEAGPPGTSLSPKEIRGPILTFRGLENIQA